MSLLAALNAQQKNACETIDQHVRIIAGAGSGKTRVITSRIAYLVQEQHIYPNKILAITFTNKAAKEMKERVALLLDNQVQAVFISTIHSFCVRVLREDIMALKYPRNFTILDSDDQKSILKDAYRLMDIDQKAYSYGNTLSYISHHKVQRIDAQRAKKISGNWIGDSIKADVYEYYERRLKEMYALDFDDLLLFADTLLSENKEVRQKWQHRFDFIHVDEFQDVDLLQYNIIKQLTKSDTCLCVVGDPDQTIYTWRGAQVDIIMNFEKDFKPCKTVILNENYRSTPQILAGANALISHNKNRVEKDLFTNNVDKEKIRHFVALSERDEPLWVAAKIHDIHTNQKIEYKSIAILYRSNYLSRGLEKELLNLKVPYRIYGGVRFYDRAEIKDAISYLRLVAPSNEMDPYDYIKDLAIKRVLNVPKRGIGDKSIEQIALLAKEQQVNMYEALKQFSSTRSKLSSEIENFIRVIETARKDIKEISIDQVLEKILDASGYLKMLEEDKEIERLENIKELISDMSQYVEEHDDASLQTYLQDISIYSESEGQPSDDVVQLMSIHAAKGLEFDHVFVYNLCEGVFPSERSIQEGGQSALEEERRLAYVAFTRAKKQLYLSSSYGYSYILDKIKTTSRFIDEIPLECVETLGSKPRNTFAQDVDNYQKEGFQSINKDHNSNKSFSNFSNGSGRKVDIKKEDLVVHSSFGEGYVTKVEDGLATIAFDKRFGIRKIQVNHPSLSKK